MKFDTQIIAVDWGQVNIGFALGRADGLTKKPLKTYKRTQPVKKWVLTDDVLTYIKSLLKEHEADVLVFGLPLNADGSDNNNSKRARKFVEYLKHQITQTINLQDENSTTQEDHARNFENNDQKAAFIILQRFIDSNISSGILKDT